MTTAVTAPSTAPRRRRGLGWLVALLLLAAVLVAADRIGVRVAESRVADRLAGELGTRPAVDIRGVPFLTQALGGRYRDIRVSGADVRRGAVHVSGFSARLQGVHLPLSQALRGTVSELPVDRLSGTGLVTYADLQAAVGARGLTLAPADDGQVRVSGTASVLGRQVPVTALSDVSLDGDQVVLAARRVEVGGREATGAVAGALSGRLDLRVPVPELPYGLRLTALHAGPQGITVSAGATGAVLQTQQGALPSPAR